MIFHPALRTQALSVNMSQISATSDVVLGSESGAVHHELVRARGGLPLRSMAGHHALAGFGHLSISIAVC